MKTTFIKSIILSSFAFILMSASCSSDDDTPLPQAEPFTPITLDLTQVEIDLDDTSFIVDEFTFEVYRCQILPNFGIDLAYGQNGNASYIELDLSQTQGISKITSRIFVNSTTPITFYNNGTVVDEITAINETPNEFEDNVYELNGQTITSVRITSFESLVESITLE